jgi:long-chain fatty acid transport protein
MKVRVFTLASFQLVVFLMYVPAWGGGAYLTEISSAEVGLAGAGWAARAQDAGTLFSNPAGMTRIEGNELYLGLQPMYFKLEFDPDSNTTVEGEDGDASDWLVGGSGFYVHSFSDDLKFGVGVLGYFGLGIDFGDKWVGRYYVTEGGMQGLTFIPSIAYRINDRLSLGVGVDIMYVTFDQKASLNNPDAPDGSFKLEADDVTYGLNLGVLYELNNRTRFGLQYISESDLELKDKPKFKGVGPILDAALGAAGLLDASIKMDVTAPQSVMLSAYHDVNERWAIMGNIGWQEWSEFGKVRVQVSTTDITTMTLDSDYDDSWHVALGTQWKATEPLLVSFGIAYDSSIVDDDDRTLDLPMGESWRFGSGAHYTLKDNLDVSFAYELWWFGDLEIDVDDGPLTGRVSGEYEKTLVHVFNIGLIRRF